MYQVHEILEKLLLVVLPRHDLLSDHSRLHNLAPSLFHPASLMVIPDPQSSASLVATIVKDNSIIPHLIDVI